MNTSVDEIHAYENSFPSFPVSAFKFSQHLTRALFHRCSALLRRFLDFLMVWFCTKMKIIKLTWYVFSSSAHQKHFTVCWIKFLLLQYTRQQKETCIYCSVYSHIHPYSTSYFRRPLSNTISLCMTVYWTIYSGLITQRDEFFKKPNICNFKNKVFSTYLLNR
jgi:hypothetical protein